MFERFTEPARQVVVQAQNAARTFNHDSIGTEHILLGVVRESEGVAARILLGFGADSELIRREVIRLLPGPGGPPRGAHLPVRWKGFDAAWLGGLGPFLDGLAAEIRQQLGREPDPGDLLLALACARETLAARALRELGVEPGALWGAIERVRDQDPGPWEELMGKVQDACRAKERAIEAQEFENAAGLRDQERYLRAQAHAQTPPRPEVAKEIRRHLGIPSSSDNPPHSE